MMNMIKLLTTSYEFEKVHENLEFGEYLENDVKTLKCE